MGLCYNLYMIKNFIFSAVGIVITAYILKSGVHFDSPDTLTFAKNVLLVTIILSLVNTLIKPIISIVSIPINIVTIGLFSVVINGFMVYITDRLVSGFTVHSFLYCIYFAIVLSIIHFGLSLFNKKD